MDERNYVSRIVLVSVSDLTCEDCGGLWSWLLYKERVSFDTIAVMKDVHTI